MPCGKIFTLPHSDGEWYVYDTCLELPYIAGRLGILDNTRYIANLLNTILDPKPFKYIPEASQVNQVMYGRSRQH